MSEGQRSCPSGYGEFRPEYRFDISISVSSNFSLRLTENQVQLHGVWANPQDKLQPPNSGYWVFLDKIMGDLKVTVDKTVPPKGYVEVSGEVYFNAKDLTKNDLGNSLITGIRITSEEVIQLPVIIDTIKLLIVLISYHEN